MVMYDNELKKEKIKFRPRIKLNHNFSMERRGGRGENNVAVTKKIKQELFLITLSNFSK